MSEASSMRTSGSLRSPFPHPRLAKSRTYIRSAPHTITQFRRADLPRQSRNTFNTRKTGMPSQTAVRVETIRLKASAINRLSTHAMHARVSADQTTQASAPADAMIVATSGESDRTSFIVFLRSPTKSECQVHQVSHFRPGRLPVQLEASLTRRIATTPRRRAGLYRWRRCSRFWPG
jgi:hypothetical protein